MDGAQNEWGRAGNREGKEDVNANNKGCVDNMIGLLHNW